MSAPAPSADRFSEIFDSATHQIFPARTKLKDLAYWVTEIFAAVYLFILIRQMKLIESPMQTSAGETFQVYTLVDEKDDLVNCEFGWIALIYTIKYVVYIADTALMVKNKYSTSLAFVPVALNCVVWLIWALYGFLASGDQVASGFKYRINKDANAFLLEKGLLTQETYDAKMKAELDAYHNNQTGTWIWVPCLIAFAVNLGCWITGIIQKKSTLFTNAAISTWAIPLQLFFLNLAMKGSWIKSNIAAALEARNNWTNNLPPSADEYRNAGEAFEARYIFFIIYFASWLLILAAVPTMIRAVKECGKNKLNGAKYILYALFFFSNFIWCLSMDGVYLESSFDVTSLGLLIIFSIFSILLALAIGIISLIQKFRENEAEYFSKHGHTQLVKPQYQETNVVMTEPHVEK